MHRSCWVQPALVSKFDAFGLFPHFCRGVASNGVHFQRCIYTRRWQRRHQCSAYPISLAKTQCKAKKEGWNEWMTARSSCLFFRPTHLFGVRVRSFFSHICEGDYRRHCSIVCTDFPKKILSRSIPDERKKHKILTKWNAHAKIVARRRERKMTKTPFCVWLGSLLLHFKQFIRFCKQTYSHSMLSVTRIGAIGGLSE